MSSNPASPSVPIQLLGQSGCRLEFPGSIVYVDPYLSHSVQELDAPDLVRLKPVAMRPGDVGDADWVLVTHDHIDHCDPHTLPGLAAASPGARFVGPPPVLLRLQEWGIHRDRLQPATEDWADLGPGLRVRAVPAAHPEIERDAAGRLACVGYVVDHPGGRLYLAGDTSLRQPLLDALAALVPITTAVLPVNERNFFRDRRGIIGNMSVREAFQMAEELGFDQVVPVHWDMFAANSVGPDEIRAVYEHMRPRFRLVMFPDRV